MRACRPSPVAGIGWSKEQLRERYDKEGDRELVDQISALLAIACPGGGAETVVNGVVFALNVTLAIRLFEVVACATRVTLLP
jgi:hypothetical protein